MRPNSGRITSILILISLSIGIAIGESRLIGSLKAAIGLSTGSMVNTRNTYAGDREDLFRNLSTERADAVFLGDSLIDNAEWHELFPAKRVINRGIQGETSSDLLAKLDSVTAIDAKRIFVMIGINDLRRGVRPETLISNYSQLIEKLKVSFDEVYLHSILASRGFSPKLNQDIVDVNISLKHSTASQSQVRFIDLNEVLSPHGHLDLNYTSDGVHLNGAGYLVWRDLIHPLIGD